MIYFIRNPTNDRIKIGTTRMLAVRLSALRVEQGADLDVLGVMEGSYGAETELHKRFAGQHVGGEWFTPSQELLDHIDRETSPWDGKQEAPVLVSTKIHADVLTDARIAAEIRRMNLADFLSEVVAKESEAIMFAWAEERMASRGVAR